MPKANRRAFLKAVGTVSATGVAAAVSPSADATAAQQPPGRTPPVALPAPSGYTFFTAPEAAFVEAAADRFIPADELTQGGSALGIATFVDRQLAGAWGSGDRMYMQGPWPKGSSSQGYQSPMTPAQFIRAGIAATNAYCRTTFQKEFDRLTIAQQVDVLRSLELGTIALQGVPAKEYFDLLLNAVMEGFFADPIYGGNKDKASWKMIGFPGVIAVYAEHIKNYRNTRYDGAPTSIADLS
jgi:gluconate 2-dehydrogenase gamma chain